MKALTIYQPWASLVMLGAKPHEFRHWDYSGRFPSIVGQRIVIHASARAINMAEVLDIQTRIREGTSALAPDIAEPVLARLQGAYKGQGILELSAGLGTAVIGKPLLATDLFRGTINDSDRIDQSVWAWPLTEIEAFQAPQSRRGAQGFWNWS